MRSLGSILRSASAIVYAGIIARSAFGLLMGVIVARSFGIEGYGQFYVYIFLMTLSIAFGEALDQGVVRFLTYRLNHQSGRAGDVVGSALVLRVGIVTVLITVVSGLVLALKTEAAAGSGLGRLVIAGLLGGGFTTLTSFAAALFMSHENFVARAALFPALNMARCAVVAACVLAGVSELATIIGLDIAVAGVFAGLSLWLVRRDLAAGSCSRKTMRELFVFSKWMTLSVVSYLMYMGFGAPVLMHFVGESEAGIFGAAVSFAVLAEHATAAIVSVQHQRASKVKDAAQLAQFIRRTTVVSVICALALSPVALIGGPVIVLTFGSAFAQSAALFPIIFAGSIIHMLSMPRALIFVATDEPQRIAFATAAGLLVWLIAALALIPAYAAWGAAVAVLIARCAQGGVLVAMVELGKARALAKLGAPAP